jgi:hypothetical protein
MTNRHPVAPVSNFPSYTAEFSTVATKNIEETGKISARLTACNLSYEEFYLAAMQFERIRPGASENQLLYLGKRHETAMTQAAELLKKSNCGENVLALLKLDVKTNLDEWCTRAGEVDTLKKACTDAREKYK